MPLNCQRGKALVGTELGVRETTINQADGVGNCLAGRKLKGLRNPA